jgi:hypothetical protein
LYLALNLTPSYSADQAEDDGIYSDQGKYIYFVDSKCRSRAWYAAKRFLGSIDVLPRTTGGELKNENFLYKKHKNIDKNSIDYRVSRKEIVRRSPNSLDGGFLQLPSFGRGRFLIAQFDSIFTVPGVYTEQVTMKNEGGCYWRAVGYYISYKPYYKYDENGL